MAKHGCVKMISQDKMSDFEEVCMILHSFRIILYAQLASCLYPLYFFSEKKNEYSKRKAVR